MKRLFFLICLLGLVGCSHQDRDETRVKIFDGARQDFEANYTVISANDKSSTDVEKENQDKKRKNLLLLEKIKVNILDSEMDDWEYGGVVVGYSQLKKGHDVIAEKEVSFVNKKNKKIKFLNDVYYYDSDESAWNPIKSTVSMFNDTEVSEDRDFKRTIKSIWNCDYDYVYNNCEK